MLTAEDIYNARQRIGPHILRTPLINSPAISHMTDTIVSLKLETLQISGSFKIRGALNAILSNHDMISHMKGVTTASAGNHAQGVAVAARTAGVRAIIVMPEWSSLSKQEAVRAYGAEVIISGKTIDESVERATQFEKDGWYFIHPFDEPSVMAGQGTIGLEVLEELPDVDAMLIPVGGGGLIAGISTIIKERRPDCRIIGVQGGRCPSALQALKNGAPVCVPASWTLADGIRVTKTGSRTYPIIENLVDEIIQVEEDEIARAILCLMERKRIIAEGAGASPLAALLSGRCTVNLEVRLFFSYQGEI
jgi:threonine dehydratase